MTKPVPAPTPSAERDADWAYAQAEIARARAAGVLPAEPDEDTLARIAAIIRASHGTPASMTANEQAER